MQLISTSSLPAEQQLLLNDLELSVPNGQRIVLRSKRLGKEIIPQLTSAHNYQHEVPLYRFLADLQHQHTPLSVSWQWGALAQYRRLPQVRYKNIILQEATWLLSRHELVPTLSADANILRLQEANQLPRFIALQQGDQELFIDLESSRCRQVVYATLQRLEKVTVVEWLRIPSECPVDGPDGKLTHELVIPFTRHPKTPAPLAAVSLTALPDQRRHFPPGSEWVYLKVYCGHTTASLVLMQLAKLAQSLLRQGQISHWFFVRYRDSDCHLRFRCRLTGDDRYGAVLLACQAALARYIASGEVYRLQADTYQRELERYGVHTIDETERLFWQDSELVIQLLALDLTEFDLIQAALLCVDAYQTSFGLTIRQKRLYCQQRYEVLFAQQGASSDLQQALARRFRQQHPVELNLVNAELTGPDVNVRRAIQRHREAIDSPVLAINDALESHPVPTQAAYLGHITHMFINRLFSAQQPVYELLIYHHLYRMYQSYDKQLGQAHLILPGHPF